MFRAKFVEKIETHTLCSLNYFPKIVPLYEKIWKNMVKPDRPQITIWHMRFLCPSIKAKKIQTHS